MYNLKDLNGLHAPDGEAMRTYVGIKLVEICSRYFGSLGELIRRNVFRIKSFALITEQVFNCSVRRD